MTYYRRKILFNLLKLSDIFIFTVSFLVALWALAYRHSQVTLKELLYARITVINLISFLLLIALWHLIFVSFSLYRSRRIESGKGEWKDILKAVTTGTFVLSFKGLFFNSELIAPLFISIFWFSAASFTILFRNFLRYILEKIRLEGRNLRFIVIVGTNKRAREFAEKIEEKKELGYRILGFIDKDGHPAEGAIRLLGKIEDFAVILKEHIVDEVVIALPVKSCYDDIQEIVQRAEEQGIIIRYMPFLFETKIAQSKVEIFESFTLLTMTSGPQISVQYVTKRILDISLGSLMFITVLPFLILAAVAIKMTSPGPILFIQQRVGYNKRVFRLYKLRTMVDGADKLQHTLKGINEMDGPVFKAHNDPRVTRVGRWLRKTSIDEFPQLINVIKGDMSLVGPRPLPVCDYNGFNKDWQRRRFSVLPGITCTWQIKGRNLISFEEWMKLDMEYIDNWKLSEDIRILFKTIPVVLRGKGAM